MRRWFDLPAIVSHRNIQTLTQNQYALIVAGGRGTRFGSPTPKQFLDLKGKPVLLHTCDKFHRYSQDIRIVLVLPESDISTWEKLAATHQFSKSVRVVKGGATRFQSVRNGLSEIPDEALVAIHDGVRPLVTPDIIRTSFELAADHGSAIAAVKLKESLRVVEAGKPDGALTRAVDRSLYRIIQTPQTFRASLIKKAYEVKEDDSLTDDASVAEKAGISVVLFDGHYNNIKITNREDLVIAEALMGGQG